MGCLCIVRLIENSLLFSLEIRVFNCGLSFELICNRLIVEVFDFEAYLLLILASLVLFVQDLDNTL